MNQEEIINLWNFLIKVFNIKQINKLKFLFQRRDDWKIHRITSLFNYNRRDFKEFDFIPKRIPHEMNFLFLIRNNLKQQIKLKFKKAVFMKYPIIWKSFPQFFINSSCEER